MKIELGKYKTIKILIVDFDGYFFINKEIKKNNISVKSKI